jgi:hypothetical protein
VCKKRLMPSSVRVMNFVKNTWQIHVGDDKEHIGTWGCNGTCNTRPDVCCVCLFCVFSQVSMFGWRFRMEKITININTRR